MRPGPLSSHYCRLWTGHEADNSPLFGVEVKNYWSYTSTPLVCLHGLLRENFTFNFVYSSYWLFVYIGGAEEC